MRRRGGGHQWQWTTANRSLVTVVFSHPQGFRRASNSSPANGEAISDVFNTSDTYGHTERERTSIRRSSKSLLRASQRNELLQALCSFVSYEGTSSTDDALFEIFVLLTPPISFMLLENWLRRVCSLWEVGCTRTRTGVLARASWNVLPFCTSRKTYVIH